MPEPAAARRPRPSDANEKIVGNMIELHALWFAHSLIHTWQTTGNHGKPCTLVARTRSREHSLLEGA